MRKKHTKAVCLEIAHALEGLYPDAKAELDFNNPYELLVATILSAQCTDVRVNQVTKILFDKAPTPQALSVLPIDVLESIIKPCGLYASKAKNLNATANQLVLHFDSEIPRDIPTLMSLPGVGKKTANVVVSNAFDTPAIAVDTHVFRVSNRLGLVHADTVEETEEQLMKVIPKVMWTKTHHTIIFHGRRVCKARRPECENCSLTALCLYYTGGQSEAKTKTAKTAKTANVKIENTKTVNTKTENTKSVNTKK